MAIGSTLKLPLKAIEGIKIGVVEAGVRYANRKDLVIFSIDECASVGATFTQNKFCAAPVHIAKRHLASTAIRGLIINTGNANAGTGEQGFSSALACCDALADALGVQREAVMPFSTGVIGEPLDASVIAAATPRAVGALCDDAWLEAAEGIQTTDTVSKGISRSINLDGEIITITGISKGAGMIKPNMATMLAFAATDAVIDQNHLQQLVEKAVDGSFNCITVDGDTSTNDACVMVATNKVGPKIEPNTPQWEQFSRALEAHFLFLAQAIVRDGEGATKFVEVRVENAASVNSAKSVAYTVAESPLVKTALFSSDPNWGRILAAVGRAPIEALSTEQVDIAIGDVQIVSAGGLSPTYTEELGIQAMAEEELIITIKLGMGDQSASVWTTDLSHQYVSINADYRS